MGVSVKKANITQGNTFEAQAVGVCTRVARGSYRPGLTGGKNSEAVDEDFFGQMLRD